MRDFEVKLAQADKMETEIAGMAFHSHEFDNVYNQRNMLAHELQSVNDLMSKFQKEMKARALIAQNELDKMRVKARMGVDAV